MNIRAPFSQEQLQEAVRRAEEESHGTEDELVEFLGLTREWYATILNGILVGIRDSYGLPLAAPVVHGVRDSFFAGLILGRLLYGEITED